MYTSILSPCSTGLLHLESWVCLLSSLWYLKLTGLKWLQKFSLCICVHISHCTVPSPPYADIKSQIVCVFVKMQESVCVCVSALCRYSQASMVLDMINELLHRELNWTLKICACCYLSIYCSIQRQAEQNTFLEMNKAILTQTEAWYSQSRFPKVPDRQKQREGEKIGHFY